MMRATREDACRLIHEGALALSRVEENGIQVDVARLDRTIARVGYRIDALSSELKTSEEWMVWRRVFGSRASLGSRPQLLKVLKQMGHELSGEMTQSRKREKADKTSLEKLDSPFVHDFLELEKLKKLHGTYLSGIRREVVDGLLHPFFNLHTVITYRSSSDRPNFQNIPIRDKLIGKLIRQCFVPRDGHVLVEVDFKQLEVSIGACYHRDPRMIEYLGTGYDFHRALAAELYMLDEVEVSDDVRYCAKNRFVFPQFYGSYFAQCAPDLWRVIDTMQLMAGDRPLKEHLAERGITSLGRAQSDWNVGRIKTGEGTFMDHVREVERRFWGERFCVYAEWKERWWQRYLKCGWFDLLTGFRESGLYKRNDVINHPVQGAAFHCLLWTLIETVKWLAKNKMTSKVVGQIHDSMLCDVHRDELDDFVAKVMELATVRLREAWRWIVVPLAVDVEVAEENWFEKRKVMV